MNRRRGLEWQAEVEQVQVPDAQATGICQGKLGERCSSNLLSLTSSRFDLELHVDHVDRLYLFRNEWICL